MNDGSLSANHVRLLDPRWHLIADAARRFYDELEEADEVISINLVALGEDRAPRVYVFAPGETDLHRSLITDLDAVEQVMKQASIDVTPEAGEVA